MPAKRGKADADADDTVVIKKYANRRLYNTATSAYVTLDDLRKMVQKDVEFRVVDAKSSEDLTRAVLTQIIVEEESRGQNLLPISFLRQIISMYEDNMRWTLPQFLETVMGWYGRNQQEMQKHLSHSMGGMLPPSVEELQRSQMALFDQTMRMLNPLANQGSAAADKKAPQDDKPEPEKDKTSEKNELEGLRKQIADLQEAVDSLARRED
ncbi:MAG TPA: polyhydroxyalkanoate synthesis repressor PhaR [Alphaproteobacteria bacterium]|nr:polyhydroxyalkanoate synthesis repressor PhaR [Alphaproteobacteria bacterium]